MSDEYIAQIKAQTALLTRISKQLETLAQASAPASPKFARRLGEYSNFDWSSIGAEVIAQDVQGVNEVEYLGHRWLRSGGSGKFGQAVWFSRTIGREGDKNIYARLITFKDYEREPIPETTAQKAQCQATQVIRPLDVQRTAQIEKANPTTQGNKNDQR